MPGPIVETDWPCTVRQTDAYVSVRTMHRGLLDALEHGFHRIEVPTAKGALFSARVFFF